MDDTTSKHHWSHNPQHGQVTGTLITQPEELHIGQQPVAHCMLIDSNKRKWRVRANAHLAGQLLNYRIGQKIKLTGVKGDLCKDAWDNAKRQIVPLTISVVDENKRRLAKITAMNEASLTTNRV